MLKVFLSSTIEDLKAERHAAADAIRALKDFECLLVEEEPPSTLPAEELVRHLIEKSDIFLMILGTRKGTESPQSKQPWTRVEYEMARTALSSGTVRPHVLANRAAARLQRARSASL
jgi:hypothetical protein